MKLIVGLGNPGEKYEGTPHNAGFMVVEKMASQRKVNFKKNAAVSELAEFRLGLEKVMLLKPLTFMNLSGQAVSEVFRKKRIKKDSLLIISDDINLPLGVIRIRKRGSDGGHKGLRSVIESLNTEEFSRLRIGVGSGKFDSVSKHVLARLNKEESELLDQAVDKAIEAVLFFVKKGIEHTMSKFNQ